MRAVSFDAINKFIEDDFLGVQPLDPGQTYGARRSKRTYDFSGVAAALTLWLDAGGRRSLGRS